MMTPMWKMLMDANEGGKQSDKEPKADNNGSIT
jgi:hypothetical protein